MRKVLLVTNESEPEDLAGKLERSGYEVDVAREAEEAAAILVHSHYDVVVLMLRATESLSVVGVMRDVSSEASGFLVVAEEGSAQELEARRLGLAEVIPSRSSTEALAREIRRGVERLL